MSGTTLRRVVEPDGTVILTGTFSDFEPPLDAAGQAPEALFRGTLPDSPPVARIETPGDVAIEGDEP